MTMGRYAGLTARVLHRPGVLLFVRQQQPASITKMVKNIRYSRTYTSGAERPANRMRWKWLGWSTCSLMAYCSFSTFGTYTLLHSDFESQSNGAASQPEVEPECDILETQEKRSTWRGLELLRTSLSFNNFSSAMPSWKWPASLDFSGVQARFSALFLELGLGPGSLYSEVVDNPPDINLYPEVEWDATVRLGEDICLSERAFLSERRRVMRPAFAKLMDVNEDAVDERDLPIIAIAGSGGGYRATLNTIGSLIGADRAGILDCTTYTAGVSGSCWALSVLHSGVAGAYDPFTASRHIKERIRVSYLDLSTLDALVTAPTNKYLLASLLWKAAGPKGSVSLVDVYGTLLASRLFVPSDLSAINPQHISLRAMRRSVDNGGLPLPIFTAIQYIASPNAAAELPTPKSKSLALAVDDKTTDTTNKAVHANQESRCIWYEFTPYEVGSDELGAWIPSWSLGRHFNNGKSTERRPELGLTILTGIFGSAFCASLKHYFKEIQPTLQLLPSQLYGWLHDIVSENETDLALMHPVLPNHVPSFLKGLHGRLRAGCPETLPDMDSISFMDAGAELNVPYYPLLRRNVDCIIALDASADSQDLWFTRAEELAIKRGLRTWPKGTGWPTEVIVADGTATADHTSPEGRGGRAKAANDDAAQTAVRKLASVQETEIAGQTSKTEATGARGIPQPASDQPASPLSSRGCEVWVGSSQADAETSSRLDDLDEDALLQRDGIGIVYIPLAPNDAKVPNFDPLNLSTWRIEVSEPESQAMMDVAEANFEDSTEKIVRLLRAIWQRKKREREDAEWAQHLSRFSKNFGRHMS